MLVRPSPRIPSFHARTGFFRMVLSCLALGLLASPRTLADSGPLPRCQDFLVPLIGNQIEILPPEAYERIRKHPIQTLAREIEASGFELRFRNYSEYGGYGVQAAMVERVLREIFPRAFSKEDSGVATKGIRIFLYDTPLNTPWWSPLQRSESWNDPGILEMSRIKSGNPMVAAVTREAVRRELGIPQNARVLHAYLNSNQMPTLEALNHASPVQADYIIASFNKDLPLEMDIPGYQTSFLSLHPWSRSGKQLILNDQRHRMMELYTAADYAFVIGANNIFEPLRAKCPTLFFKNSWPHLLPGFRSPVSYYHPAEWKHLAAVAERSGGAIGIAHLFDSKEALRRLFQINPEEIQNPAFTAETPGGSTPFDGLLDALEAHIRIQLLRLRD